MFTRLGLLSIPLELMLEPKLRLRNGVRILWVRARKDVDPGFALVEGCETHIVLKLTEDDGPEARLPETAPQSDVEFVSSSDVFERIEGTPVPFEAEKAPDQCCV